MRTFLLHFAMSYVASALLPSAAVHLRRPRHFGEIVRRHGIVPAGLALPVALSVLSLELVLGTGAVSQLAGGRSSGPAAALLGSVVVLGVLFALYVRRLLRTASTDTPCGCSPFPGRLTSASYLPALGLVAAALSGWPSAVSDAVPPGLDGGSITGLLPALWGMTLATAVALVPATVPGGLAAEA